MSTTNSKAQDFRKSYEKDWDLKDGIIQNPGKFEGQPLYVVYYWDAYINGFADRDNGKILGFDITDEDREYFPEIPKRKRTIKLYCDDMGFVRLI